MLLVYFPISGYVNVAFRKKSMTFALVFLLKCLQGSERNVCSSYLERKEIARIAENGGQWWTTVSIRKVAQREDQKMGNRKYEVRNRHRKSGGGWSETETKDHIKTLGNKKKAAKRYFADRPVEKAEQTLRNITWCLLQTSIRKIILKKRSFTVHCDATTCPALLIYSDRRIYTRGLFVEESGLNWISLILFLLLQQRNESGRKL